MADKKHSRKSAPEPDPPVVEGEVPVGEEPHFTLFRTPVEPPEVSPEGDPEALDILNVFTDPDFYFGGPGNAPAADVAPDQPVSSV